jgi:hypothetical protein
VVLPPLPKAVPPIPPDEELPPSPVALDPATPPCPVPPPVEVAPPFAFDGELEVLLPHAPIRATHAHSPRIIFGFRAGLREFMSVSFAHGSAAWRSNKKKHDTESVTRASWHFVADGVIAIT